MGLLLCLFVNLGFVASLDFAGGDRRGLTGVPDRRHPHRNTCTPPTPVCTDPNVYEMSELSHITSTSLSVSGFLRIDSRKETQNVLRIYK